MPLALSPGDEALVAYLRSLDNMLILAQTREELLEWRSIVLDLLENLGFLINYQKSELEPTQSLIFLGFLINTVSMEMKLPQEKVTQTIKEAQNLLHKDQNTARDSVHLIGVFTSTLTAILPAPLRYQGLQELKQILKKGGYDSILPLSEEAKEDLDQYSISSQQSVSVEGTSITPNRNRCLPNGLKSSMCRRENQRPVDRPYKLSGVNGSVSRNLSVCQ